MNRRVFLRNSSLAGVALSTLSLNACTTDSTSAKTAAATAADTDDTFALNEITVTELQEKMNAGQYTSRSITELYLRRIAGMDKKGPQLRSIIELNPDALSIAEEMDKERRAGKVRGPLHGIPVLIKDNINSADQMQTTAGSLALAGNKASQDAFIVKKLREAGAVLLGKTNLSEWANFRSTRSTSGWSSRGGQTKNAYILDRTPSGSSSGSGTAVAANFCALAIGTETDGSIVSPASCNGLVGFKPTVGLLSRTGIIPISATQDTAGPMTRTVRDAAILLSALAGPDPADPITQQSAGKTASDYTKFLFPQALGGKIIGVEKSHLEGSSDAIPLFKKAIELLKAQGATIVEVDVLKQINPLGEAEYDVLLYEFKDGVNKYLATANAKVKTLADVIAFNKQNEPKAMPFFKQEILEASEKLGDLSTPKYLEARRKSYAGARQVLSSTLRNNRLAAIIGITNSPAPAIDLINGDSWPGPGFSSPAAMAGYPHITVPMGQAHGLPVGLSFVGPAYGEAGLLSVAYAYEQASKQRKAPEFRGPFVG
ncbi:amidase [Hymenobacter sp. BT188]|uniref:amidase n=1 Tax=Hymenobacter sp. BT188 TaxID=2763504 RepID=UPI0016512779|nr:amidase [Hymenobacter sp. BT188]MBC6605274.1 amidase [Hymenobacter sp. BT188]